MPIYKAIFFGKVAYTNKRKFCFWWHLYPIEHFGSTSNIVLAFTDGSSISSCSRAKHTDRQGRFLQFSRPGVPIQELFTNKSLLHFVGGALMFGVILQPRSLKVLHEVSLSIYRANFVKLL